MSYRNRSTIGGIPAVYVYIALGVAALLVLLLVGRLLTAGVQSYFALGVGLLLTLGNLRELIGAPTGLNRNGALMNVMLGLGLVCFFLGAVLGWMLYIPALVLLIAAVPLALQRSTVYTAYLGAARTLADGVRRTVGARSRMP